jgi:hypothetical protein
MEMTKIEIAVLEEVSAEATAEQVRELSELQLAFIGGGSGVVIVG